MLCRASPVREKCCILVEEGVKPWELLSLAVPCPSRAACPRACRGEVSAVACHPVLPPVPRALAGCAHAPRAFLSIPPAACCPFLCSPKSSARLYPAWDRKGQQQGLFLLSPWSLKNEQLGTVPGLLPKGEAVAPSWLCCQQLAVTSPCLSFPFCPPGFLAQSPQAETGMAGDGDGPWEALRGEEKHPGGYMAGGFLGLALV